MTIVCSRCDGNHMRSECPTADTRDNMREALDWLVNCIECEVKISGTTTVFQLRLAKAKEALASLPAQQEEGVREALLQFFKWAIREGPWDGCDLDGAAIQDKAESLGLLIKTQYDAEKHGVQSDFEDGDDFYVFAPALSLPAHPPQESEVAPR